MNSTPAFLDITLKRKDKRRRQSEAANRVGYAGGGGVLDPCLGIGVPLRV